MTPNEILCRARERLGKSPFEVANAAAVSAPCYFDMESYPDELYRAVDLADVCRVAMAVGLVIEQLFGEDKPRPVGERLDGFEGLAAAIRDRAAREGQSLTGIEDAAGWYLQEFVDDPSTAWQDWAVDTVRDVCAAVNADWLSVFATAAAKRGREAADAVDPPNGVDPT